METSKDSCNRFPRYFRRLSLFSPPRNRYRWTLCVLVLFCFTLIAITKLAKSDTTITIAHFDTKIYNERILDSEDLIVANSNSQGMLASDVPRLRKSPERIKFSYTQSEGYNNSLFDCESIKRIKVKYVIASGFNSIMYGAKADLKFGSTWLSIRIVSKKSPDVSACISQHDSNKLKINCDEISDKILSHEASLLNQLRHAKIAPVLNLCRRIAANPNSLSRVGTQIMILEDAKPLDMNEMLNLDWKLRVKICIDIGKS